MTICLHSFHQLSVLYGLELGIPFLQPIIPTTCRYLMAKLHKPTSFMFRCDGVYVVTDFLERGVESTPIPLWLKSELVRVC
jgi:hypothetical protein